MTTDELAALIRSRSEGQGRYIVALAGAPGAGKSTLAEALVERLGPTAALVPMDGFHLDNAILDTRGRRFHKGSPDTFDVAGFESLLLRLKSGAEVIAPVFDRSIDLSRGSARVVAPDARIIVAEGNYLLLADPPWDRLQPLWNLTIFLDVPEAELERRLIARWHHYGLSDTEARRRADLNDIPNARTVIRRSVPAEIVLGDPSPP